MTNKTTWEIQLADGAKLLADKITWGEHTLEAQIFREGADTGERMHSYFPYTSLKMVVEIK